MKSPINKDIFSESGCQNRDLLLKYISGKLSASEKHDVERHLVDCQLCSDALDGLRQSPSIETMNDINSSLNEMVKGKAVSFPGKYYLAAASIAAVMVLSYVAYKQFTGVKEEKLAVTEAVINEEEPIRKNEATLETETLLVTPSFPKQVPVPESQGSPEDRMMLDEVVLSDISESDHEYSVKEELHSATGISSSELVQDAVPVSDDKVQVAEPAVSLHSASNSITYIDNLKVIEYPDPVSSKNAGNVHEKHTPSTYQNREQKLEAAKAEQEQGASIKRSANYQDMVTDPLILYNKGRYESAIRGFDQLLENNPNDYNALFYKGMSLYHLKKFNSAISHFKKIGDDEGNPFSEEALFYMAKSYAEKGDTFNAVSNFNRVVYSNGFYSGKANDELNKLK